MNGLSFTKMHGLGNDFVILDNRDQSLPALSKAQLALLGDRNRGIGCDQLAILTTVEGHDEHHVYMTIHNADGSEAEACGNMTRCVASLLFDESPAPAKTVHTVAGELVATQSEHGITTTHPVFHDWWDIPLDGDHNINDLPSYNTTSEQPSADPLPFSTIASRAVGIGNPHFVCIVEDVDAIDLPTVGPLLEKHACYPKHTNVEVVQVISPIHIIMRVWERGVGITQACGSGACASVVAAVEAGLVTVGEPITVSLPGGDLTITYAGREATSIRMAGPTTLVFTGQMHWPIST